MLIGYARVSKTDGSQSLDLQRDALRAEGIDGAANLYHDVASGVRWRSRAPGCGRRHAVGVAMVDHRGKRPDPDPKPPVGRTLWRGVRRRCPHMGSRVGQLGYANWPDPASHRGELKPTSVGVEIRTHNIPTLIKDRGPSPPLSKRISERSRRSACSIHWRPFRRCSTDSMTPALRRSSCRPDHGNAKGKVFMTRPHTLGTAVDITP